MKDLNVGIILDKMMKEAEKNGITSGKYYVANPAILLRNRFLSSSERLVLMELFHWFKSHNQKQLHQPIICENADLSDKTVRDALKSLKSKGFISSKRTGKANVYTLLDFSINPIIVLGNVIREHEKFMNTIEKERIETVCNLFRPLWTDKNIYEEFLAKLGALKTSEERYNSAMLLVKQFKEQKLETPKKTKAKLQIKRKENPNNIN